MTDEVHTRFPGPVLLLAGPGTGKTHSLALRVKWLIEKKGVSPDEITLITFTGEAARNMRHRLSDAEKKDVYLSKEQQPRVICTMHSLGHGIVSRHPDRFGLCDDFRVVFSRVMREILFEDAAQLVGTQRTMGREAEKAKRCASLDAAPEEVRNIAAQYDKLLRACNAIDYDDQILLACQALREDHTLLHEYQAHAQHLLVDEYQDINGAQFELIRLLSSASPEGLFVVGDDDQSIYSFRGGSPSYLRNFGEHFGDAAHIGDLDLSRRCRRNVLASALAVVKRFSIARLEKRNPRFEHQDNGVVKIHDVPSESKEAQIIAAITAGAVPSRDVLILVPAAPFATAICRALRRARIGFEFKGPMDEGGFGAFQALKDWLSAPEDNLALRHLLQKLVDGGTTDVPSAKSRMPEKLDQREEAFGSISNLWSAVLDRGLSLRDALAEPAEQGGQAKALTDCLTELRAAYKGDLDAMQAPYVRARFDDEGNVTGATPDPASHLEQFGGTAFRILRPWSNPSKMLDEISAWVQELRDRTGVAGDAGVRIMTMHSAKGLEADLTIIVGLEEGVFPRKNEDEVDEKARQLFVSMTRARSEVHLFHARTRNASSTYLPQSFQLRASRFLGAVPEEYSETCYVPASTGRKKTRKTTSSHTKDS